MAERIVLEVDEKPAVQATQRANLELLGIEKTTGRVVTAFGKTVEGAKVQGETIVRVTDRSRNSVERLVAAVEKQAQVYGKTGVDRLIAQKEQLIQRLGNEQAAVERATKAYDRMIAEEKRLGGSAAKFGDGVKNFIQNPLQAAGDAAESFLSKIGPVGAGIGIAAAGFGLAAKAAWGFAKDLAQIGDQAEDTAARMGLSIREEEAFRFAMNRAGGDMGQLEGIMRKLSQEIEGGGKNLSDMGVDFRDVQTGAVRPMSQIILELSRRLAEMPEGPLRNAAAIKVMGRSALEVLPDLLALDEGVKRFSELKVGLNEEQVRKFGEWQKHIAEVEARWETLRISLKETVVGTVSLVVKAAGPLAYLLKYATPGGLAFSGPDTPSNNPVDREMAETGGWGYGASMSRRGHGWQLESIRRNDEAVAARLASTTEDRLAQAKDKLAGLRKDLAVGVEYKAERFQAFDEQKRIVDGLEAQSKAEKDLDALRKQIDAYRKQGDEAELSSGEKILYVRDQMLQQAERLKASARDIAAIRSTADKLLGADYEKARVAFEGYVSKEGRRRTEPLYGVPSKEQFSEWEWGFKADTEIPKIQAAAQRSMLQAEGAKAMRMAELAATPSGEVDAITRAYQIRLGLARQIREEELAAISEGATAGERRIAEAKAEADTRKEIRATQIEAELKLVELQRRRVDELKSSIEGLLDAAFTKSRGILDALKNMGQAVFLTPLKQGISSMMAQVLMPVMYGKDGRGGLMGAIYGIFGQRGGGIQDVQLINGAVPVVITNGVGSGSGSAMASAASLGALVGGMAMQSRVIGGEAIGAGRSATAGLTQAASGLWQRGGVPAGSDLGMYSPSGQWIPFEQARAAVSSGSGFGGKLAGAAPGLAFMGGSMLAMNGLQRGGTSGNLQTIGGGAAMGYGLAGQLGMTGYGGAIFGAGAGLAAAGLQRGGWSGLGMSTAGGAIVGMQLGGPLGAAIGAGVGFVAGLVRMFIKGATEKAREKITATYGVDVSDKGVLRQIVDTAKQAFGGNLDMAIRSQQVRDLVELYAMSTGQKPTGMPGTARPITLAQMGGSLFQQPGYANGTALPGLGGLPSLDRISGGTPSNAGGTIVIPLQIDSKPVGEVVIQNGRVVAQGAITALKSNSGRRQMTALQLSPGLLTS